MTAEDVTDTLELTLAASGCDLARVQIEAFVNYYNHRRYHKSLKNLTPADVYSGRGLTILLERNHIKRKIIQHRRLLHQSQAA